ncbi:HNH endonuclease [Kitasatospora purpeofusca]|uniref:HNH endonuclease n=1 Tax=Kitasatospora purpeofusca TaxID=67352 RepID=UPI00365EB79D
MRRGEALRPLRAWESDPIKIAQEALDSARPNGSCLERVKNIANGYAGICWKSKQYRAHRFVYEHLCEPLPPGVVVHHKCGNKLCINPQHLQPVFPHENVAEMFERNTYLDRIRELESEVRRLEGQAE